MVPQIQTFLKEEEKDKKIYEEMTQRTLFA